MEQFVCVFLIRLHEIDFFFFVSDFVHVKMAKVPNEKKTSHFKYILALPKLFVYCESFHVIWLLTFSTLFRIPHFLCVLYLCSNMNCVVSVHTHTKKHERTKEKRKKYGVLNENVCYTNRLRQLWQWNIETKKTSQVRTRQIWWKTVFHICVILHLGNANVAWAWMNEWWCCCCRRRC